MPIGGGPEVPGRLRDQVGQILQGLEQIGLAGDTVCMGVLEEDGATHYRLGTRIRQITRFADQLGSGNPDRRVTHAVVLHGGEGSSSQK
jgi:hypothetical protein